MKASFAAHGYRAYLRKTPEDKVTIYSLNARSLLGAKREASRLRAEVTCSEECVVQLTEASGDAVAVYRKRGGAWRWANIGYNFPTRQTGVL